MVSDSCIAVASTPLHILYLIEFVKKYKIAEVDLLVIIKRKTDKKQIEAILEECSWRRVIWAKADNFLANKFISLFEVYLSFRIRLSEDYTFGVFADYGRTFVANISCKKYYWLGDGTKVLYETSPHFSGLINRYKKQKAFENVVYKLFRKALILPEEPKLYTPFELQIKEHEKNDFAWLKEKYRRLDAVEGCEKSEKNKVYFFGAYFCEVDGQPLMSEKDYVDVLKRICARYAAKGWELLYIPHRHESQAKLKTLESISNLKVQLFDYPAEYQFIVEKVYPLHIASFSSTCLFNFHYLGCSESIESYYIDFSRYEGRQIDRQELYYTFLRDLLGEENVIDVHTLGEKSA